MGEQIEHREQRPACSPLLVLVSSCELQLSSEMTRKWPSSSTQDIFGICFCHCTHRIGLNHRVWWCWGAWWFAYVESATERAIFAAIWNTKEVSHPRLCGKMAADALARKDASHIY